MQGRTNLPKCYRFNLGSERSLFRRSGMIITLHANNTECRHNGESTLTLKLMGKVIRSSKQRVRMAHKIDLSPTKKSIGCLADTGFHHIEVNYRRRINNAFMHLLFKMLYLYYLESKSVNLY